MSELRPFPFESLLRRLRWELATEGPVFGLPRKDWHRPDPILDLSFQHAGRRAANPFGPAAGPHTQLAQNLVQGWLAGARVFELKTIQVLDRLEIPRPCIHAPHYALNVEWSQELRLEESVREYQKAAWLLEILQRGQAGGFHPHGTDLSTVLDLSVGYSLEGIRSPAMTKALAALRQPQSGLRELADSLSPDLRTWAGDPPSGPLADCITLSTFHGCPPGEIEAIASHLLEQGWSVIIKFNPTLCGLERVRDILHRQLGYSHLEPDPEAFAQDLDLPGAVGLMERLRERADARGLMLGAKFSNTLVLKRDPALFPPEAGEQMYLSGAPLHPLALCAASEFVARSRLTFPLSFSAGLDAGNALKTMLAGFSPLTLCTDLLRRGGQGRLAGLLRSLSQELGLQPEALPQWRELSSANDLDALRASLERAAADALREPRYQATSLMKPPRKRSTRLERLDCINCDLCLPACPNGALFGWELQDGAGGSRRQIGVLADACNACSNCETWCPEQGAPWRVKERWHQSLASLESAPEDLDGFCLEGEGLVGRVSGRVQQMRVESAGAGTDFGTHLPEVSELLLERFQAVRDGLIKPGTPASWLDGGRS